MDKCQDAPIPNASNQRERSCTRIDNSPSYVGHLLSREFYEMQAPWKPLLPPMDPLDIGKCTLVLDMDGTLLTEITEDRYRGKNDARFCGNDFVIDRQLRGILSFISMRPHLGQFLKSMAKLFEIVIFTESPQKRADAILDRLPNSNLIRNRLYRDSCTEIEGKVVKDLSLLGRDLSMVVIVDDCPFSYSLQPSNAFPIKRFVGLASDSELLGVASALTNLTLNLTPNLPLALESITLSNNHLYWWPPLHPLKCPLLPLKAEHEKEKHTLVLDMDGTLLDHNLNIPVFNSQCDISYKRPGVDQFLVEMAMMFELVLFTASDGNRASMLMKNLFSRCHLSMFSHILSREACLRFCTKFFIKDLSLLGRDLSKVILIDDNPVSYELQPFNAIPIKRYRAGDTSDSHLTQLIPFLRELVKEKNDVRPLIRAKYHDLCFVYAPPKNPN